MKEIGKVELFTIALGSVIGWGAFILPGSLFLKHTGVINTFIGFVIAIVMIAFIEKSYSLLMSKYNAPGGEYTYAKNTFGNNVGFFTGWILLLAYISIIPLNATAIPMVFEKIVPFYTKGMLLYTIVDFPVYLNDLIVSILFILLFTIIQINGITYSTRIQNFAVFTLLISITYIFVFTLFNLTDLQLNNFNSNLGEIELDLIIRIVAFAPWAFIGFDTVAQMASESKVSPKIASLMAFFAVIFGGAVYNAINVITAFGISNDNLISSDWATGEAVFNLFGNAALMVIGLSMLAAVLSGLNGFFMSSTRLAFAMLEVNDKKCVTRLNKQIIIFISLVSIIVPFFGRNALFWFVDVSSVGASFAYLITCVAAYHLAKRKTVKFIVILGILSSISFLIFLLTPFFGSNIPEISALVLLFWIILGMVILKFKDRNLFS